MTGSMLSIAILLSCKSFLQLNNDARTEEDLARVLSLVEQRILIIVSTASFAALPSSKISLRGATESRDLNASRT